MSRATPSDEQVCAWFDTLSNWGRWGDGDLAGTLNLITAEKRLQAAGLAREGVSISCALPILFQPNDDDAWPEPRRFMNRLPQHEPYTPELIGRASASEAVLLNCHGLAVTHLDGLAHSFFRPASGRDLLGYNGLSPSVVSSRGGASTGAITVAGDGIVSRGVLLDIAQLHGVDWLEAGTKIFPEDLEAAEARQGVTVGAGDVLCVRSGHPERKRELGWNHAPGIQAGPDGACLPWLRERDVAVLACDTANDVFPPDPGHMARPIHCIGIPALGLWLLDGADYEDLAARCTQLGRWEFQLVISPLRLDGCTASPVNPVAVL